MSDLSINLHIFVGLDFRGLRKLCFCGNLMIVFIVHSPVSLFVVDCGYM